MDQAFLQTAASLLATRPAQLSLSVTSMAMAISMHGLQILLAS